MNYFKGRVRFLLAIIAGFVLLWTALVPFETGTTFTPDQDAITSTPDSSSVSSTLGIVRKERLSSDEPRIAFRHESQQGLNAARRFLRISPTSTKSSASASATTREIPRRRLPGGYDDPATAGVILFVIVLLFLLFCCRGCLCDLLACVCLYEICCGDGAVGGFDLMPDC
mmetsp:Transcript_18033/g.39335  ORF Transcript_18033/g.39335 Transcript_18033/m.39335 type:complete len:170 (+) Transcript_18033:145-654(+)